MTDAVLARAVRRETHSPRTGATVVVLVVIAVAAVFCGIEIVLRLLGAAPLLIAPEDALAWVADLPTMQPAAVVGGGAAAIAAGVVLVWLSLSPGRRPMHTLGRSSRPVVVDNGVIASAVAERVRRELDLSPGAVVVGIGHRRADVAVRPESGQQIESGRVRAVAEAEIARYETTPPVKVQARVTPRRVSEEQTA